MTWDSLLPRPVLVRPAAGVLELDQNTTVGGEPTTADWFRHHVGAATGLRLADAERPTIEFRVDATESVPGGYRAQVRPDGVAVVAHDAAGAHHAAQTLRQLLDPSAYRAALIHYGRFVLPCGEVEDRPRFAWRGCHLDVARHFLPKREVLRFIELLAMHKLNVLHLHLTDDQGWRIEVPRYPELTRVGAWRKRSMVGRGPEPEFDSRPHGGFYTTDDLREIVAHAARHHITVVPEVDVPGHSQAAIAAYPELGGGQRPDVWESWGVNPDLLNTDPATTDFYRAVLDHVMEVFPSPVICIGGDEVPGITPEHGTFLRELIEHVHARGRRASGWDEVMETVDPLPAGTIIAAWRDEQAAQRAVDRGHDVVLCPESHFYLDHRQADHPAEPVPVGFLTTLEKVYGYQPRPDVLGIQAQVWTEHLDTPRRVDYAVFPRLSAFAEVSWSQQHDLADFQRRLVDHHLPRLDACGVEYRPLGGPHPWQTRPGVPGRPR
ncbi:beta-N-acetylhexosaminidase [Saccharopolyspora sp. NPDC000359]|uniref:beta-N-acetylhexosaminidase n=1 Tax=Saccharopolyspora sp. NPDC000359 TaxID=3154251 RepID=UPI00331D3F41